MTFIALEGGEGFGKSTQIQLLKERLPEAFPNHSLVFTREPGGTPFAERTRELLFSKEAEDADGVTLFGLFAAARADHVRRLIRPRLEEGNVVITDRFAGSSFAYQGFAEENPISEALFREHCDSIGAMPDLTLIFEMDPEVALERIARRASEQTHFDARDVEFHFKLYNGYVRYGQLLRAEGKRVAFINADQSIEAVFAELRAQIRDIL